MNAEQFSRLVEAHLEGTLTAVEAEELSRALVKQPELRRQFWEHSALHGLTQEAAHLEWLGGVSPAVESKVVRVSWWCWAAPLAAAAAVALFAFAWWQRMPHEERGNQGVAVLSRVVGVEWVDAPRTAGTVLAPGALRLKSGAVQIEFYSGARVVVEGPAEFRLVSTQEGFLAAGRLTAHVPIQARGFKIGSTALTVVDLGTDFGVKVAADAPPEVHVFSGKVEVALNSQPTAVHPLAGGAAVRLEAGALHDLAANRAAFLGEPELVRRDVAAAQQRQTAWLESSKDLSVDPAVVVHFTFEKQEAWERTLANQAANATDETCGNIVGCEWVDGRWPEKRALEFRGEGDRVRLNVATPLSAVTFLAWLRVDGLPHDTHALFNADGERTGALRWELTRGGKLRLGVARPSAKAGANWEALSSPVVVAPERLGQWLMLVSVFDGKRMSHYADGRLVATRSAAGPLPTTLGSAELGNWMPDPEHQDFSQRGFRGRMDEFALLSRALSAEEVQALYQSGRPDASTPSSKNTSP